ncbi:SIS domain-containing protein, partial [Patescibacteria group bacterium]|nr:SIS domain-containing protein [Patescibacteria group bacterium]
MTLEDIRTYQRYDKQQIGSCNERLQEQVAIAWEETRSVKMPAAYRACSNIVFVGMGGSALGADLIKSVYFKTLKIPFEIVRNYTLPATVGPKTLVILSSFSGNTEEILYAAKEAKAKRAKIVVIASGGKLASLAKREKVPAYIFTPGDLAQQPRLGLGFSMAGILGLLARAGMIRVSSKEIEQMRQAMNEVVDVSALDIHIKDNPAKTVARALQNRAVMIVGAEHLVGNAHVLANQINESSKQFAMFTEMPELNHHLIEGLTYPSRFFEKFTVLMI